MDQSLESKRTYTTPPPRRKVAGLIRSRPLKILFHQTCKDSVLIIGRTRPRGVVEITNRGRGSSPRSRTSASKSPRTSRGSKTRGRKDEQDACRPWEGNFEEFFGECKGTRGRVEHGDCEGAGRDDCNEGHHEGNDKYEGECEGTGNGEDVKLVTFQGSAMCLYGSEIGYPLPVNSHTRSNALLYPNVPLGASTNESGDHPPRPDIYVYTKVYPGGVPSFPLSSS